MRLYDLFQGRMPTRERWRVLGCGDAAATLPDLRSRSAGCTVLDASSAPNCLPHLRLGAAPGDETDVLVRREGAISALSVPRGIPVAPPVLPLWVEQRGRDVAQWAFCEPMAVDGEEGCIGVRLTVGLLTRGAWTDIAVRGPASPRWTNVYHYLQSAPCSIVIDGQGFLRDADSVFLNSNLAGPCIFVLPDVLYAFAMLHCRNVTLVERQAPRAERRRAEKNGTTPPVRYHELVISRTLKRFMGDAERAGHDRVTALHMVRGHFKTYTADRPLLGRFVGTWWWHQAMRGDESKGVVIKDYRLGTA